MKLNRDNQWLQHPSVAVPCALAALCYCMVLLPPFAAAQPPFANPPSNGQPGPMDYNPLPTLPRPADQPASLFQPAPAGPVYVGGGTDYPYFESDPLLDRADMPQPGWLFDVELGILGSHVFDHVGQFAAPLAAPVPFDVSVPMAKLDWTVSPRLELGYRLPSGFGEIDAAYRLFEAHGSGTTDDPLAAPDGPAALTSHLHIDLVDLDYANHERSLAPAWDMKWRIGLRTADALFDSRADESLTLAGGGSGYYRRSIIDNFWGIGPHAGVELRRQRNDWGLSLIGRLDGALLFGNVRQTFTEVSTSGTSDSFALSNPEQAPILGGFLGLNWQPPQSTALDLEIGWTGEYWWNVGRLSDPDLYNGHTAGEIGLQGATLRLEYNY